MKNKESRKSEPRVQEVNIVIPPDGGYGWIVLFASFMSNFCVDGIAFSFGVAIKADLSKKLGLPDTKVAVINSIQLGVYYLFGPLACAFVNHYGFRTVGVWGCTIAFAGIFAASHIDNFTAITILYGVIGGLGLGMIYTAAIISVGYYFEKYRALATGIAVCGSSIGGLCLSPLFAYISVQKGWDYTMKIESCFLLVCLFSSLSYRPLKPTTRVPLTQDLINEIESFKTPSRVDFVELYKTDSMVSIDLDDNSEESRHFPQISIISSRFLPISEMKKKKQKRCCSCSCLQNLGETKPKRRRGRGNLISTGPMDRKDIFYSASVVQLPEYQLKKSDDSRLNRNALSYHVSMIIDPNMIRTSIDKTSRSQSKVIQTHDESNACLGISHLVQKALKNLFDVTLLKSVVFCILALACCCYALVWLTPYSYLPRRSELNNIPIKSTNWFVSYISIGNAAGRATAGVIATLCPRINPCYLAGIATITAGSVTIATSYYGTDSTIVQIGYCVVFGFCIAFLTALRPIIFVKLLGLSKLTNAFGLSALGIGIALLCGLPIASVLIEKTGSFEYSFVLTGISFILCGVLLIVAFHVNSCKERKNKK